MKRRHIILIAVAAVIVLGGAAALLIRRATRPNPADPDTLTDQAYIAAMRQTFLSLEVDLQNIEITGENPDQRELVITVSSQVGDTPTSAYNLVTGVQFVVGAPFLEAQGSPRSIETINVVVQPPDGDPWLVAAPVDALLALMTDQITEEEFVTTWQVSRNAPDLTPEQ